jgi:hypothetical protein
MKELEHHVSDGILSDSLQKLAKTRGVPSACTSTDTGVGIGTGTGFEIGEHFHRFRRQISNSNWR